MTASQGLSGLSLADLHGLRDRITTGVLAVPLTRASLQSAGLGDKDWILDRLAGLDRIGAAVALDLVIAERAHATRPSLDLVWTGPEATASTARDTWVVMRELFTRARERVLIAGFTFDSGAELFEPLHRNMAEHGVKTRMFLDVPRAPHSIAPEEHARSVVHKTLQANWPWPDVFPEFYYDPRTVTPTSVASLHAKCVVVDERLTLIGSANFTDRGQSRNIEVGVLIEDPGFARQVVEQWQGLVNQKLVHSIGTRAV
jgi:phosphatidylserine/phosphatidylglycerophosphate/cardiolipin synthase-like enzyme